MRHALTCTLVLATAISAQTVSEQRAASSRLPRRWNVSLQTGFAETFQLTLGGTFGEGPAWQNKATVGLSNVFASGDSAFVFGWNTLDTPSHNYDWQAGGGYKTAPMKFGRHSLQFTGGIQRWVLPSVATGAKDWLAAGNATYQVKVWKAPFVATGDSWTLLASTLPKGSLLHSQFYNVQPVYRSDNLQVSVKHGPQHTWSWNFYGTNGNRVIRYQAGVMITFRGNMVEAAYRKQWGRQPGIPSNNYWVACYTRSFNF